jgi:hypothetical protein
MSTIEKSRPIKRAGAKPATSSDAKAKGRSDDSTPKPKRVSALDAAAQVLQKAGEAMNCSALISAMAKQRLWKSPGGKTPHATLYSAILREIVAKGKNARFKKIDRGQFAASRK